MTLHIPDSLSLITLRQFMAYHIAKDDAERVSVVTGVSIEEAQSLPIATVQAVLTTFNNALARQPKPVERVIALDAGKVKMKVGLIPDFTEMTLAEHIQADNYAKTIWPASGETDWTNLPKLLAIFYRPVTSQLGAYYDIEPYDGARVNKYMQFFDQLTMESVNSALLFFSTIGAELRQSSRESLISKLEERTRILKRMQMMEDIG